MIAVALVKSVPLSGALRLAGEGLSRQGLPHGLDPINALAIEWALRARDAGELDELVALTMGPDDARDALRSALALGCDRAVHVRDERLTGADVGRTIAVLAEAVRALDAGLALSGYESADGSSGAVPAGVASALDWPLVTRVLDATLTGGALQVARDAGPARQVLETSAPAVLSFVAGELVARYATLKATIAAKQKPIVALDLDTLGGVAHARGASERVIAVRSVEAARPSPIVLDAQAGAEHVHALLAQLVAR
jgi:electron transfer flavoprotein beta subunit